MKKIISPLTLGNKVLIRTVTHYFTGRIILLTAHEIVLADAAWIADTGRFYNALKDGILTEVEPFVGPVSVNREAVIDATEWKHPLPEKQQ